MPSAVRPVPLGGLGTRVCSPHTGPTPARGVTASYGNYCKEARPQCPSCRKRGTAHRQRSASKRARLHSGCSCDAETSPRQQAPESARGTIDASPDLSSENDAALSESIGIRDMLGLIFAWRSVRGRVRPSARLGLSLVASTTICAPWPGVF